MVFKNIGTMFFDEVLTIAMNDMGIGCVNLEEILEEKNSKISYKTISAYMRGMRLPSYERAKILFAHLQIEIQEDELIDLLNRSRERIKNQKNYFKEEATEIRRTITIRIKPKNISPGLSAYQGMRVLEERIKDMFGDETKLSDYVKHLITKDLKEFVLEKNDIIDEEE